jgi:hypothetical protein
MRTKEEYQAALEKIKSRLPLENLWRVSTNTDSYQKLYPVFIDEKEVDILQELIDSKGPKKVVFKYEVSEYAAGDCGGFDYDEFDYVPYCPTCGKPLYSNGGNFCVKCGTELEFDTSLNTLKHCYRWEL